MRQDQLDVALIAYRNALRVAPPDAPLDQVAGVVNVTGRALLALVRPEEAPTECRDFLARHPDERSVRCNMPLALLLLGRFQERWRACEDRFDLTEHHLRPEGSSLLDPAPVGGEHPLILTEQGRGDMLKVIRYAPLLAERDAEVWGRPTRTCARRCP